MMSAVIVKFPVTAIFRSIKERRILNGYMAASKKRDPTMTPAEHWETVLCCSVIQRAMNRVAERRMGEAGQSPISAIEDQEKRIARLLQDRRARAVEEQAQQEGWIELSRNVERWPADRRYRSGALVDQLRKGGEDEEPELAPELAEARDAFQRDVRARRDEILAEMESKRLAQ